MLSTMNSIRGSLSAIDFYSKISLFHLFLVAISFCYARYIDNTHLTNPLPNLISMFFGIFLWVYRQHERTEYERAFAKSPESRVARLEISRLTKLLNEEQHARGEAIELNKTYEVTIAHLNVKATNLREQLALSDDTCDRFERELNDKANSIGRINASAEAHWKKRAAERNTEIETELRYIRETPAAKLLAMVKSQDEIIRQLRHSYEADVEAAVAKATKVSEDCADRVTTSLDKEVAAHNELKKEHVELQISRNAADARIASAEAATKQAEMNARHDGTVLRETQEELKAANFFASCLTKALPPNWVQIYTPAANQWLSTSSPPASQANAIIRSLAATLPSIPTIRGLELSSSAPFHPSTFAAPLADSSLASPAPVGWSSEPGPSSAMLSLAAGSGDQTIATMPLPAQEKPRSLASRITKAPEASSGTSSDGTSASSADKSALSLLPGANTDHYSNPFLSAAEHMKGESKQRGKGKGKEKASDDVNSNGKRSSRESSPVGDERGMARQRH